VEVVPSVGPIGCPVIVRGQNFNNPAPEIKTTVKFGDKESVEVEVLSDTEIRAITPVFQSGPVDVTVNMEFNDSVVVDTLPNGFTYDGFFVFDPAGDIGKEGGIFDPDSGQNIPIQLDIPLTSLPPNDRFPSIYIKPVTRETLLTKGFEINRIVGDLIIEIKVRNEAGDMVTRFDDSIFITFFIAPDQALMTDVLLLSDSTPSFAHNSDLASKTEGDKALRPIPTISVGGLVSDISVAQSLISPPALIGKIKRLSADSNYLTAGINHAPTINTPGIVSMASLSGHFLPYT